MARFRGAASLPDDDDLLREILVRLPPQPSSLVRASAVCKRWRRLATDPKFLQCFRDRDRHQRPPPLLGVFEDREDIVFIPTLDPPNRIPPERFDLPRPSVGKGGRSITELLGCRHGHVLFMDWGTYKVVVCDPITGEHCRLDGPPEFDITLQEEMRGAVLCAAAGHGQLPLEPL